MKRILFIMFASILLVSCWRQSPPDSTPRKLPPRTGAYDTVHVYGPKMVWDVEKKQYIESWGKVRDSLIPTPEYEVVMNGEQIAKYSKASGQGWNILLGILVLVGTLTVSFFLLRMDAIKDGAKGFKRVVAVCIAIALAFFTSKPGNIAQNNAKTIHEKQLKYYQSIDPELNYFWDSLFNNNKIQTK